MLCSCWNSGVVARIAAIATDLADHRQPSSGQYQIRRHGIVTSCSIHVLLSESWNSPFPFSFLCRDYVLIAPMYLDEL